MATNADSRLRSDLAVPPGELIEEELSAVSMTVPELAVRLGCPEHTLVALIRGEHPLTRDVAHQLERVLGVPAHLWLNIEARYRRATTHARASEAQDM